MKIELTSSQDFNGDVTQRKARNKLRFGAYALSFTTYLCVYVGRVIRWKSEYVSVYIYREREREEIVGAEGMAERSFSNLEEREFIEGGGIFTFLIQFCCM